MGSKISKGAACGRVGRGEKGSEKRKEGRSFSVLWAEEDFGFCSE